MSYTFYRSMSLRTFFKENQQIFEQILLEEAESIRRDIRRILRRGQVDLMHNAQQVIAYALNNEKDNIEAFAQKEGKMWAEHTIDLSFKLEWVHALRRTVWTFVEKYHSLLENKESTDFFSWEREVNDCIDLFLNTFVESYTTYREEVMQKQERLVESLSVPIIPINNSISVLPLIGAVEESRLDFLKEKVLEIVAEKKIHTLIVDLSGIGHIEKGVVNSFNHMIDGISLMGCKTVITGIPSALAMEIATSEVAWKPEVKTLGTLQQALNDCFLADV
ncbi:STAS domain-containing protein [Marinococcus halotolerans]|uniref:STAS domain-containing protein n=1 Tax=Marinococcus halotolerans TaxID=301092 RepID=UPI0003B356A8|nr:STAS domain-containing protein [Marinococcus halotolerans]